MHDVGLTHLTYLYNLNTEDIIVFYTFLYACLLL